MDNQVAWAKSIVEAFERMYLVDNGYTAPAVESRLYNLAKAIIADSEELETLGGGSDE